MEIPLKYKYRAPGRGHKQQRGGHNNQNVPSGKHVPHPLVHAYVRDHMKCNPQWNTCRTEEWRQINGG